ncbi:hypothetical protein TcCL_ESM06097 [Trypanosoma cruzi]|nr:hypothetical protein TcCL_ESM06097 [Trypanosoma cruzi]
MAARHRTPRVSIAPPPSSFQRHTIGSIRTRRHATLNDPTGNRPTTVAETTHPRQSTRRNIMSIGPRRQKNVMSTVWPAHGTIDRRNREGRQALDQGLSKHTYTQCSFDAAAAATGTVPERKMTSSKKASQEKPIHTSICKAPLRLLRLQGPWAKMRLTESRQLCQSPLPPM